MPVRRRAGCCPTGPTFASRQGWQALSEAGTVLGTFWRPPPSCPRPLLAVARVCRLVARLLAFFWEALGGMLGDRLTRVEPGLVAAQGAAPEQCSKRLSGPLPFPPRCARLCTVARGAWL